MIVLISLNSNHLYDQAVRVERAVGEFESQSAESSADGFKSTDGLEVNKGTSRGAGKYETYFSVDTPKGECIGEKSYRSRRIKKDHYIKEILWRSPNEDEITKTGNWLAFNFNNSPIIFRYDPQFCNDNFPELAIATIPEGF